MAARRQKVARRTRPLIAAREFRHGHLTSLRQVCSVCQREASHDRHQYAADVFPCCSPECVAVVAGTVSRATKTLHGSEFLKEIDTLESLTFMEREAIKAAREQLYDALVEIGIADAFNDCTADQIDLVIEAVWAGLRASMHLQSAKGDTPF